MGEYGQVNVSPEQVIRELKALNELPEWCYANQGIVYSLIYQRPFRLGIRGKAVYLILLLLRSRALRKRFYISIARWSLRKMSRRAASFARPDQVSNDVFVGFGAGSEEYLYQGWCQSADVRKIRINQSKPEEFAQLAMPDETCLEESLRQIACRTFDAVEEAQTAGIRERRLLWHTSILSRIGTYVYVLESIRAIPEMTSRISFLSPDVAAFAAIDARGDNKQPVIEFLQHGLLRKSNILPRFDRMMCCTELEGAYAKAVTGCEYRLMPSQGRPYELSDSNVVLFCSNKPGPFFDRTECLSMLTEFRDAIKSAGMEIVIRPHPREPKGFWESHLPEGRIDYTGDSIEAAFRRLKPRAVAAWWSTTLVDALRWGILPVIIKGAPAECLDDLIVPIKEVCVRWPSEADRINRFMSDPSLETEFIQSACTRVFNRDDPYGT